MWIFRNTGEIEFFPFHDVFVHICATIDFPPLGRRLSIDHINTRPNHEKRTTKYPNISPALTKEVFALSSDVQFFHNAYIQVHILFRCLMSDGWIVFGSWEVTSVHQELEWVCMIKEHVMSIHYMSMCVWSMPGIYSFLSCMKAHFINEQSLNVTGFYVWGVW